MRFISSADQARNDAQTKTSASVEMRFIASASQIAFMIQKNCPEDIRSSCNRIIINQNYLDSGTKTL